jgi:hypothetical protein
VIDLKMFYYKPILSMDEYIDDLSAFTKMFKNISRYRNGSSFDASLVINQLTQIFNMFLSEAVVEYFDEQPDEKTKQILRSLVLAYHDLEICDNCDAVFYDIIKTECNKRRRRNL